jgi:hypothetical protein
LEGANFWLKFIGAMTDVLTGWPASPPSGSIEKRVRLID